MAERRGHPAMLGVWPAMRGVRARTTATAVVIVAAVLTGVAVAVVAFIDRTLTEQVRDVASARAQEVAAMPDPAQLTVASDEEFVQLVRDGLVIASTPNVDGEPPVVALGQSGEATVDGGIDDEGPFLVVARDVDDTMLLVGRSLDDAVEATRAAAASLAVAVPIVVAFVGLLTWLLVGRALAPIDAMRAEADRISASELHRRVPDLGAHDEVGRLARTLNGMLARLDAAQRRQRRFVSDASHELRSPLASIRQHAELAWSGDDPAARKLGATILLEADRLEELIAGLLLLARLDEAATERVEEVDVDDLVLAEAERLRATTQKTIDTGGIGAGRVEGDRRQLARLFRNLAHNAARHARDTIGLAVATVDDSVIATVDDDGPGIPSEERLRALERFVRLDEGRARGEGGTGLGLAIVHEVAVAHGGRVDLDTSALGGLRVTVTLPAAERSARGQAETPTMDVTRRPWGGREG